MKPGAVEIRREALNSEAGTRLICALNAELSERYPEGGTALHFRLDANEISPGRGAFLVGYASEIPVACGAVRLLDAETAEIKRMYVEPTARGRGLGRRMLQALEAEARLLGAHDLVLETGTRQPEAIALYSRAGFSKIGAFGEYEDHPLSVFMGKTL